MNPNVSIAPLVQSFFTTRLMQQKQASPHTINSYRDTFRLLLKFLSRNLRRPPTDVCLEHLNAKTITAFLHDLEKERNISARSRNLRLSAIRSFFRYVAFEVPSQAAPRTSSRYWLFRESATREGWLIFLHDQRRKRCSELLTWRRRWDDATTLSCCWHCKPVCVSPNSSA
jgi:integrase